MDLLSIFYCVATISIHKPTKVIESSCFFHCDEEPVCLPPDPFDGPGIPPGGPLGGEPDGP